MQMRGKKRRKMFASVCDLFHKNKRGEERRKTELHRIGSDWGKGQEEKRERANK